MGKKFSLFLILLFSNTVVAQEYPYEDLPEEFPVEVINPSQSKESKKIRGKALFRWGIKAGVNYTFFSGTQYSGFSDYGYEGALSGGWDLAGQPIFLELESGYRYTIATHRSGPLSIIPVRFGTFYRSRLGDTSMWKVGVGPSFDVRIIFEKNSSSSDWALVPSSFLSFVFESSGWLAEMVFNIHRFSGNDYFMSGAFRTGLRF